MFSLSWAWAPKNYPQKKARKKEHAVAAAGEDLASQFELDFTFIDAESLIDKSDRELDFTFHAAEPLIGVSDPLSRERGSTSIAAKEATGTDWD